MGVDMGNTSSPSEASCDDLEDLPSDAMRVFQLPAMSITPANSRAVRETSHRELPGSNRDITVRSKGARTQRSCGPSHDQTVPPPLTARHLSARS